MADSSITKQALAASLKELMQEMPFEKINVAQICERCGMNRKSFYYHFKDKYDLVNWIFDTDFIAVVSAHTLPHSAQERWDLVERICEAFYRERDFYRKAFQITGQNAFSDHFAECIRPLLKVRLLDLIGDDTTDHFPLDFYSDAILCAIRRWLLAKDCMPPKPFVSRVKRLIEHGAATICQEMEPAQHDASPKDTDI